MARTDKSAAIAELKELFSGSSAVLVTEYRGLTVAQMKTLRRAMGQEATYVVAKNTLARIAAKEAGIEGLDDALAGPTALAFVTGDIASAAKAVKNFAKDNPALIIKSGVLEGNVLAAEDVQKLADLESREVLLAKAAGALKASLHKAAYVFTAPATKLVRTVDALRAKQEEAAA
ncbi:50S ribosomal protein L10 [Arcanobacterium haemolyticum]|uniref:Large ribosomal subunit protein uL10 n=1 Tax=Arcanobacterium haemolyticum (strain ATCC 9345 / DSM 20595 / CCM 5947 / CCUG 17215 / LMG 16163 / NBRC 15585 / NCTC 8452 / 11018) TaxID=644284 RepID=D7BKC0_ARCHD|nr:50S ribosomal protein L10 [Arcanobacterium haemolyticum]ADH93100.1 ribosomal protein L10 [Arcanobacterium haemolyticum DSM 20595]QCX47162.1 50S ribosomal protein L10 [Arcanobacterium haemolyticum]SPT75325.1 50S ribosomal protein L10 [Arcanobacterium haemolyticum]SQH28142.1 50S ribosomal protein L10 [Arcanobacterium haemolyticum]